MRQTGCIMTTAPDIEGHQWEAEVVRGAYHLLNAKRRWEIRGGETDLTDRWLTEDDATVALWIAWEGEGPIGER